MPGDCNPAQELALANGGVADHHMADDAPAQICDEAELWREL
jgi:hypothetical protein